MFNRFLVSRWAVFGSYALIFLILAWRLFAINSSAQLFLYGDNLQFLNALTHYIQGTPFWHPIDGFIGSYGMLGAYALSDPQVSFFYLPFTLIVALGKIFHFGPSAIYYSLLLVHTLHLLMGAFAVFLAGENFLRLPRRLAWLSGIIYLGLGWNVAWMDAGSLSFMIGWVPMLLFALLMFFKKPTALRLGLYLLAFTFFLYAGGLINFFFYIWVNGAALVIGSYALKLPWLEHYRSLKAFGTIFILAFVGVPLMALGLYSAQLALTLAVTGDITHTSGTYDYLAFFGLKFSDLAGLLLPRLGLLEFGANADPKLIVGDVGKELYMGLLPLGLLAMAAAFIREKRITLLLVLLGANLALSFGGTSALYHLAMLFPGNTLFRGHYKFLMLVGWYAALLVPLIIAWFHQHPLEDARLEKVTKVVTTLGWLLGGFGMLSALAIMAYSLLAKDGLTLGADYVLLSRTFAAYLFRTLLFLGISWYVLSFVMKRAILSIAMVAALASVMVLDTSINYVYAQRYAMPIKTLTEPAALTPLKNKKVYVDIPGYTQAYFLPEVMQMDVLRGYSPIPNANLVTFTEQVDAALGDTRLLIPLLQQAGVERLATTNTKEFSGLNLVSQEPLSASYTSLYTYRSNGSMHEEWGPAESLKSGRLYIYEVPKGAVQPVSSSPIQVTYITDGGGTLATSIPFSSVWQATSNGEAVATQKTNTAFLGVNLPAGKQNVIISLNTGRLQKGIYASWFFILLSVAGLYAYRRLLTQNGGMGRDLKKLTSS